MPPNLRRGPDAISPTAHYTGHVWVRNGLSHPELATPEGRVLFDAVRPLMLLSRALGGTTLEGFLLARHRVIDALLTEAIEDGRIGQVVEVACGMSPRGWRFSQRYGDRLTYVEADLPAMAERKRGALARIGPPSATHRVVELDALRDSGPDSLAELAATLDHERGLAIITEGLLTYFPSDDAFGMLRRFAAALGEFPAGLYLADIRLADNNTGIAERAFRVGLSAFVRGGVYVHFRDEAEAVAEVEACGFTSARLHRGSEHPAGADAGPGADLIHVLEAQTLK